MRRGQGQSCLSFAWVARKHVFSAPYEDIFNTVEQSRVQTAEGLVRNLVEHHKSTSGAQRWHYYFIILFYYIVLMYISSENGSN